MDQGETQAIGPGTGHDDPERPTVLFISDCHLGADDSAADRVRQARVLSFLQSIDPSCSTLYVVGDLFDFWFSYRHAIPRLAFGVLARLAALRQDGLPITYVAGNHDFWAIPFLRDELGFETIDGTLSRTLQGRRFLIAHGDGLGSGDHGYKALKRLFRNRLAIALYRLLHPDLGIQLARASSRLSRSHAPVDETPHVERLFHEVARPAFAAGYDVTVFGHLHQPTLRREDGKTMMVIGDWLRHDSYGRLERGRLTLLRLAPSGAEEVLAQEAPP